jgi:hypothetical protein
MHVRFKGSGTYEYRPVSTEDFEQLCRAKSVGKHLNGMGIVALKIS